MKIIGPSIYSHTQTYKTLRDPSGHSALNIFSHLNKTLRDPSGHSALIISLNILLLQAQGVQEPEEPVLRLRGAHHLHRGLQSGDRQLRERPDQLRVHQDRQREPVLFVAGDLDDRLLGRREDPMRGHDIAERKADHLGHLQVIVVSSKTFLKSIGLYECYIIQNISFAYDNKHICCNAITNDFKCSVRVLFRFT